MAKTESERTIFFEKLINEYTPSRLAKDQSNDVIQIKEAPLVKRETVVPSQRMYSTLKKYRRRTRRL